MCQNKWHDNKGEGEGVGKNCLQKAEQEIEYLVGLPTGEKGSGEKKKVRGGKQ